MAKKSVVAGPKVLDQEQVNKYVKFKIYENKLGKYLKKLSGDLKDKLRDGWVCPTNGPGILVLNPVGGREAGEEQQAPDWKAEFQKYLMVTRKLSEATVQELFSSIELTQPMVKFDKVEPTYRLEKKVNEKLELAAIEKQWDSAADSTLGIESKKKKAA